MKNKFRIIFLCLYFLVVLTACAENKNSLDITLRFQAKPEHAPIYYANVVFAGEKFHWYSIKAGEIKKITLKYNAGADKRVTLFYQFLPDTEQKYWQSLELDNKVDFGLSIMIDENGLVIANNIKK